jgi:hypothetical protein
MLLLKAVATALVLIAGAAVVLWYANTLNSWVLGGLIGGLAALLLSIPISLVLFSYLSHRHDGRLRMGNEAYDEAGFPVYEYDEVPERVMKRISIDVDDEYPAYRRGVWGEEPEDEDPRYLPAPARQQLPPPRVAASDQQSVHRPSSTQRDARETRQLSQRDFEVETRTPSRRSNNPGFPGYQTEKTRGQHQSQALRIAREEAYRRSEKEEEIDDYPPVQPRYSQRGRRIVDANPSPNSPYRTPANLGEDQARQIEREEDSDPGVSDHGYMAGDLKKPHLRRAPYMYDTDALKNELAQQVDPPVTRRSTRYLSIRRDEE